MKNIRKPAKENKEKDTKFSKYEEIIQKIHSAPNEFLRQKWKDVLAALEKRDKESR